MSGNQGNVLAFLFSAKSKFPFWQRLRLVRQFYVLVIRKKAGKRSPGRLSYLAKTLQEPEEIAGVWRFLFRPHPVLSFRRRLSLVARLVYISFRVACPHAQYEILHFIQAIVGLPPQTVGCIVEAGCYKGGSTAKFSLAAGIVNRQLVVFDSFAGLPEHHEAVPRPGTYRGALDEVQRNVGRFGNIAVCRFVPGWFADTMPGFAEPIAAMFLDVDLATSTRTCLKHLYPLLTPGGTLISHDGHLPAVMDVYNDQAFWETEVGCPKPAIERIGKRLVRIVKAPLGG